MVREMQEALKGGLNKIEIRLLKICENCIKANGYCIKDEAYIGLCAQNDKEELIEIWNEEE